MPVREQLNPIAVFGAGGFGLEVAMLIEQINTKVPCWDLIGFFDDGKPHGAQINHWSVLGGLDELNAWREPLALVLALGKPATKAAVVNKIENDNVWYPILVHPTVIVGPAEYVEIGEGSIICAQTIITTNIEIGRHVILNLSCTVGHETSIGDFSSFMPTCNISGEVRIGEGSFWGTGAKVINRITIGENTIVGAGAVVTSDIPPNATAVGVPARVIK